MPSPAAYASEMFLGFQLRRGEGGFLPIKQTLSEPGGYIQERPQGNLLTDLIIIPGLLSRNVDSPTKLAIVWTGAT